MTTAPRKNTPTNDVTNCLLYDNGCAARNGKSEGYCKKCGWDVMESRRRKQLIRQGSMTMDGCGCRRLLVTHEEEQ